MIDASFLLVMIDHELKHFFMSAETSDSARCKWLPPHNLTIGYNESLNLTLEVTTSTNCEQRDSSHSQIHLFTSASQDPIDFNLYRSKVGPPSLGDTNETCVENHTFSIEMTPRVHKLLHGIVFARNCHSIGIFAIRYHIIDDSSELIVESHAVTYNYIISTYYMLQVILVHYKQLSLHPAHPIQLQIYHRSQIWLKINITTITLYRIMYLELME